MEPPNQTQGVRARESVLLFALLSVVGLFLVAHFATRSYQSWRQALAASWLAQGRQALAAGRPEQAVRALYNAWSYAPRQVGVRLELARALMRLGHLPEAEAYLQELWGEHPGDGVINLELARLEAQKGDPVAVRYYENAIYGVWSNEGSLWRWRVREELFRYWVQRHQLAQARAQLLGMISEIAPEDAQRHVELGQLFLEVGDAASAYEQFTQALQVEKSLPAALAGAGQAAFALRNFPRAQRDLQAAIAAGRRDPATREQLAVVRFVLAYDPFLPGLARRAQRVRLTAGFRRARQTLQACLRRHGWLPLLPEAPSEAATLWNQSQELRQALRRSGSSSAVPTAVMEFVFRAEDFVARQCGGLPPLDRALWLIGQQER